MPTADAAAQRALLSLADTDRRVSAARHRRDHLPELAVIAEGESRGEKLGDELAVAEAEAADIDAATKKLDGEIDAVRARAKRDDERLQSGAVSPKEMTSLQQEIEALARRQASLEDDELELMERREAAETQLSRLRGEIDAIAAEVSDATGRRDEQWAEIDAELADLDQQRSGLVAGIPEPVLAIYDKRHAAGNVGAAALAGETCGACQMALDRQSLDEIRGTADDVVARCPECSALLVRAN